jgi:hypothetical protein
MPKSVVLIVCLITCASSAAPAAFAGVSVSAPGSGATVQSPVHFVASANSSCSKGVASMGIYTAAGVLAYTTPGASLNTNLNLGPGTYYTAVQEWDNCGGAAKTLVTIKVTASSAGVHVSSPANNGTTSSPVSFVASAASSCAKGVAAMGIYTAPGQLAYTVNGASLNKSLALNPGTYNATVEAWDNCGGAETATVRFTVSGGSGHTFYNLQRSGGWGSAAQAPPNFVNCSPSPCDGISFGLIQGINSPSISGNSTEFKIGNGIPYTDAFFNNHLLGDGSSQGLPDTSRTLVPTLHNFIYDVYFYGNNLGASQALEFDINQFTNGLSFIFGHECRIAGGHQWDVWNNQAGRWAPTGIPCYPNNNAWNHLTIQVQRTSDNQLLYKSITLNGQQHNLNWYFGATQSSWYGVTINYQMDGDSYGQAYNVWLDNLTFTYW